jgi:hypothetical protein
MTSQRKEDIEVAESRYEIDVSGSASAVRIISG